LLDNGKKQWLTIPLILMKLSNYKLALKTFFVIWQ